MPVTINGTTGIAGVDGSASTPAVQGSDTNTGIFYPAADTIAFGEGGAEVMRINSSGNVGIGTSSPGAKLEVNGSILSSSTVVGTNIQANTGGALILTNSDATNNFYVANVGSTGAANAAMAFVSTGVAERMRIDTSGNVGIGTNSPSNTLHVQNGLSTQIRVSDNTGGFYFNFGRDPSDGLFQINGNQGSGYKWLNNGAEVVRINSSGNLGVGTNNPSYKLHVAGTGSFSGQVLVATNTSDFNGGINLAAAGSGYIVGTNSDGGSSTVANVKIASWDGIGFAASISGQPTPFGQNAGWISCRTGAMSIRGALTQNASDRRLKENLEIIPNALDKINQINGYTFDWRVDECLSLGFKPAQEHEHGVIAQEIQAVVPDAVVIAPFDSECERDGTHYSRSGENYLTVKIEKLIPLLLQGIKELSAKVDAQAAEIAALKAAKT